MSRIFVTSDWHFNHEKPFLYEPRGFDAVWKMNNEIIARYNSLVKMDDEVFVLGDCMLGNNAVGAECIKQLKGQIHLILGNHDTNNRVEIYRGCWNICDIQYADRIKYNGYHFYLSHYPSLTSNFDYEKPLSARTLNLCGHTHTTDPFFHWQYGPIYHCEVDAHNCAPVLLDDIIVEMEKKYAETQR